MAPALIMDSAVPLNGQDGMTEIPGAGNDDKGGVPGGFTTEDFHPPMSDSATRLKVMIQEPGRLIVCPGVYDGLSARIAMSVGFDGLYMTGAGTTVSRLGQPDLGIAQLADMRGNAEMISNLDPSGPPVIADMDVGFGGPVVIAKSVAEYVRAGVAGFHIEDQVMQKRCGHLSGKKVVSREEYWSRIRACKLAKDQLRSNIVLIARTDANQEHGYDECIARLKGARDIGADMGVLEAPKSKEEAERAVKDLAPWPLMLNSVENGASPLITVNEARSMGYRVMVFSFASLAPAYRAIKETLEGLKQYGVVDSKKVTPAQIFNICGMQDCVNIDTAAGGSTYGAL